jgi:hypothetical protein
MSLSTVEIRIASANPSLVELQATGSPAVVQINMGPTGPAGAAGTNGTNGGSTSAWKYKSKTNATSGYPGNGYLLWNNATQTSATSILVSHLTDDDTDIELFLSFFVLNQKIFIQDRDDSSKNQVWLISGTPTVTGANTSTAYYTFPVTLVSSAGGAFTNNHSLLFGQISVATNAVTSATTSDGTATLSTSTLTTGTLTVSTSGVFNATSYTYGTGAASAMRTALDVLPITSVITVTGTTPAETQPLIEQASLLNGKRWWAGGDTSVEYDGTDWLVHTFDGVNNYDANFTSTTDKPWNINPASWNVTNGSGQPTLSIDLQTLQPIAGVSGTIAIVDDQEGRVAPSDMTGLGTDVATALSIAANGSGGFVTDTGTVTLTNKTLTSPAINSATFGTAATFNATSYTYGTGAATEHMASIVNGSGIRNVFCYDDFIGTSASGGAIGELGWIGTATMAIRGNELNHPGIFRASSATTGNLSLTYLAGAGNPDSFNGLTIEGVFRIGAITNCRHTFGVGYVGQYMTNGYRGITFDPANSANWRLHHRTSAGADTFTDTGKAAVANDWVRVKLTFASGLTTCTIATTSSTTDATVTNSGAYTVGTAAHTTQWVFQSTSGTQTLDVDAFMMHGKTTRL